MAKSISVRLPGKSPVTLTAAGTCTPCEARKLAAQSAVIQESTDADMASATLEVQWEGELGYENLFTGDGRFLNKGSLRVDPALLPQPLRWTPSDLGAHGGAIVVGLIEEMSIENGVVKARGMLDISNEHGQEVYRGLKSGKYKGVSLDLDEMDFEIRVKKEIYEAAQAEMDDFIAMLDGEEVEEKEQEKPEADENGYVKVFEGAADDEVMYVTDALIRAATIVDIPAFKTAYVRLLDEEPVVASGDSDTVVSLAASAAPLSPPTAWFEDPKLAEPTPLTFTEDGRVFGHIALWGTCHTGFANQCVTAPYSQTNYAWFRTGVIHTAEGQEVAVGRITMDTGHASTNLAAAPAAAHYDNTGNAVADVSAGEDSHGIWVAGSLRPEVTAEQLRALRSSPMSGDWRTVGGALELIHVLAVNLPGFPVPRTKALVASGRTATLLRPSGLESKVDAKPSALETFIRKTNKLRVQQLARKVGQ